MKKYSIEITETLQKTITVEAETPEQAMSKVRAGYEDGTIVLGGDDMVGEPTFSQRFDREDTRQPAGSTQRHERAR